MSSLDLKKRKFSHGNKSRNYYLQKSKRQYIEPGFKGFLATCNFREKDCVRECYNILNQYANDMYGPMTKETKVGNDAGKECDVTDELAKQINAAKEEAKEKKFRFQVVDTETSNCIFIKSTLDDPVELGLKIVRDIDETKARKTRFLLRLVPVSSVCKANLKDIVDAAGTLFDKHFLKESHTYSIIFNKRYNNSVKRDDVIKELADLVAAKNADNKVDLKNPELCILVEVIKGLCCLSVLPDYLKLKKYNLVELAGKEEENCEEKTEPMEPDTTSDDKSNENEGKEPDTLLDCTNVDESQAET